MKLNTQYNTKAIYQLCLEQGYISKELCSYREFYDIIREFNKGISNKIIYNQYTFKINIGYFRVIRVQRRGKSINWGASNKRKQELIEQNLVPYNKETAPHGLEWFIYHEGDYFIWNWFKDKSAKFIKNVVSYKLLPTAGNRKEVAQAVKLNPDASYGLYK